ncbi:hypothetical protein [Marinigracilibium pacificum]|uniref:Cell division protein ZapB n=1 Tax=Marinigracilibium pacificum TaxID=2729599 RepID=A0A848IYI9_9BACT|nr:hypothetical protein [Marinigracilibium pacificum]NMM49573.1 hypothetical protein [Marinigracilibium pacificum]
MVQEDVEYALNSLERKIKLLQTAYRKQEDELHSLRNENSSLKRQIESKNDELDAYKNKLKISSIVDGILSEGTDTTELKSKLDQYISELDKCIEALSDFEQ